MNTPQLTYITKVDYTRVQFYTYVMNRTEWSREEILNNISKRHPVPEKETIAKQLLHEMLTEKYKCLDAEIITGERERDMLFPPSHAIRSFTICIKFENNDQLNKMKLKHPKLIKEITGK